MSDESHIKNDRKLGRVLNVSLFNFVIIRTAQENQEINEPNETHQLYLIMMMMMIYWEETNTVRKNKETLQTQIKRLVLEYTTRKLNM
jgi:hypothetical protein